MHLITTMPLSPSSWCREITLIARNKFGEKNPIRMFGTKRLPQNCTCIISKTEQNSHNRSLIRQLHTLIAPVKLWPHNTIITTVVITDWHHRVHTRWPVASLSSCVDCRRRDIQCGQVPASTARAETGRRETCCHHTTSTS